MASSYSTQLRVELMAIGEKDATWGTINNTSIELLESSIAGRAAVTHDDTANYTLTTANGSDDEARHMILNIAGALTAARNAVVPTQSKVYIVKNATTGGYAVTVKTSGGTGISVPNGKTMILFCDGTNVVEAIDYIGGLTLGGAIVGAVSQNVFNTVSTTVNAFGAATTLNIGASTGTTTVNNAFSSSGTITLAATKTLDLAGSSGTNYARMAYSSAGNTSLLIDNTYDSATAEIRLRTRTLGTPVNCAIFTGTTATITGSVTLPGHLSSSPSFAAGDKYLLVDASGNVHVSALGPAS